MSTKEFLIENGILLSYKGSAENVEIPEEVEKIGVGAFKNNHQIKSVVFACKNLKSIEEEAFYGCTALEGIKIPIGTVQIANRAFIGCSNMEYIYIPSSVMIIGENATDSSVAIFGASGSEAEKYAKTKLATFKTDFSNGLDLINNKNLEKDNITSDTFDVFGEEIKVSSTLVRYHSIIEYYNNRQEDFFDEMMTAVPKNYVSNKNIANVEPILMGEREKTVKRLEKSGIFISEGKINTYVYDSFKLICELFTLMAKSYTELHSSTVADINNQVQHFYEQAESQVTGLNYGYIGDSVGMVAYAFDDYFEKKKQRKKAYAVAEKQKKAYINEQTAELNKTYAEFYNSFVPLYKQASDLYIEALLKCELDYYVKHALIEDDIKDKYDVEKSSELMQGLYETGSPNAEYVVALALKFYPMNVSAHVYAIEKELVCEGLEKLRSFLGLNQRLQHHKERVRAEKFEKVSNEVCNCYNASDGICLIERNSFLTDNEVKTILKRYSIELTQSVEKIVEQNPDESIDKKVYCEQKLNEIISKDSWKFFDTYGVLPIKQKDMSKEGGQSFDKTVEYLEDTIIIRQREKAEQLKLTEESLDNAKTIKDFDAVINSLTKIGNYKNAKALYDKAVENKQALENYMIDEIKKEIRNAKTSEDLSVLEEEISSRISLEKVETDLSVRKNEINKEEKKKKLIKLLSAAGTIAVLVVVIAVYSNTAHYRDFKKMTQTGSFYYSISNIDSKLTYDMGYRKWACKTLAKRLEEFQENDDIKSAVQYIYESGSLSLYANESFMDWLILGSVETGEYISENEYVIEVKTKDFQKTYLVFWEKDFDGSGTFYISNEVEDWDKDDLVVIDTVYKEINIAFSDRVFKSYEVGLDIDYSERMKKAEEKIKQDKLAAEQAKIEAEKAAEEAEKAAKEAEEAEKKRNYENAVQCLKDGKKAEAAVSFGKAGDYLDAKEKSFEVWDEVAVRNTISAGNLHTVALHEDSEVIAIGDNDEYQCGIDKRNNVIAVDVFGNTSVALDSDHSIYIFDRDYSTESWNTFANLEDIVAVSAGGNHTACLKYDGTVVVIAKKSTYNDEWKDVESWTDIVAVSSGGGHLIGLKLDGTVVAVGDNACGQCDVGDWKDVVAVSSGYDHTVGLKSDGTVVATGDNKNGQCNVEGWSEITALSAGTNHTVGLKFDGTAVATKYIETEYNDNHGQCNVEGWSDIVAISAGYDHTVGLKSDGTVVATEYILVEEYDNYHGQCDVSGWSNIKIPSN